MFNKTMYATDAQGFLIDKNGKRLHRMHSGSVVYYKFEGDQLRLVSPIKNISTEYSIDNLEEDEKYIYGWDSLINIIGDIISGIFGAIAVKYLIDSNKEYGLTYAIIFIIVLISIICHIIPDIMEQTMSYININ